MNWLVQSVWDLVNPSGASIFLALVSAVCGAWIGGERERHEKPAGMRTLILVCLGAAVFTMVGFAFTSSTGDSGRVAAQIVTGIGFLGAGVILHERRTVSGATTAATIWVTAAIGMAAGAGYAGAALGLAFLVRGVLGAIRIYECRMVNRISPLHLDVLFRPDHGKTRALIAELLCEFHATGEVWQSEGEFTRLQIALSLPSLPTRSLVAEIARLPEVIEITEARGVEA